MNLTEKAAVLLYRYEAELEQYLPLLRAKDIIRERHSIFMDMLEDRLTGEKNEIDDAAVAALLVETGSPAAVAAEYKKNRYLVGPGLFPLFSLVGNVVFSVLFVMACIGGIVFPDIVAPDGLLSYSKNVAVGLLAAFGGMCLAFFILQQFVKKENLEEAWDPSHLSPVEYRERPDMVWLIIYLVFLAAVGVFLNVFLPGISLYYTENGNSYWIPVELTHFVPLVPWLTAILAFRFIHTGVLLYMKSWTAVTRITDLVLHFSAAVIPLVLFVQNAAFSVQAQYQGPVPSPLTDIMTVFTQLGRVGLLVIAGALFLSGLYKIFKLIRKRD